MKPLILLSAGYKTGPNGQRMRYLYQNYADAITLAGGIPVLPLDSGENADELFSRCDGLLLTGGPDLDPALYHQQKLPECGAIDSARDEMELRLLDSFVGGKKPIFGICRGIQIINVYFGGTLWQDLPTQTQTQIIHSGGSKPHDCVHTTELLSGSLLRSLYGESIITNSYHHQAVDRVAQGFAVTAVSGGIIEGIAHETLPVWAVQWHPERMTGPERYMHHGPESMPIFKSFVAQCSGKNDI